MNLRNTAILFALFLTMLWVFGLMLATKQPLAEEGFLFPKLKSEPALTVDTISYDRNLKASKDSFAFLKSKESWQLVVGKEATVVDASRVKPLIERIRNAKHNPDATLSSDLASLGLDPPMRSITIKGRSEEKGGSSGRERSWTLQLGDESADKMVVYAISSEQPGKVFALNKKDVEPLLFEDPVMLHSQLFFNFPIEEGAIRKIAVTTSQGVLELSQTEGRLWKFEKPALGYAEYERPPAIKELKGRSAEGGVKGLIYAIRSLRVGAEGDFLPLGKASLASYGLEEGKESMRIHVVSQEDKTKKEETHDVLLVGKSVSGKWSEVYVRMAGDPAVAKMDVKHLALIQELAAKPAPLRSHALTFVQPERVTRLEIQRGKEQVELTRREGEPWKVRANSAGPLGADDEAVEKLLETLLDKQAIESFGTEEEAKKTDAEKGFEAPRLEVKVIETTGDADKGEGEAKKKERFTSLVFGETRGDVVQVKRTLPDGQVSRFEVLTTLMAKITGENLTLTFLDLALPRIERDEVATLTISRGGSPVEIQRDGKTGEERWLLKDAREASGFVPAELKQVHAMLERLGRLRAEKWVKKVGPKEDLSAFGLDKPAVTASVGVKNPFSPAVLGGIVGFGAAPLPQAGLIMWGAALAHTEAGPPEILEVRLGKDSGKEGGKQGVYASHSRSDAVFLVPPALLRELQTEDFRDRKSMFALQPALDCGLLSQGLAHPLHLLNLASPLATGRLHAFDPAKVKELKWSQRTSEELRQFSFSRTEKEGWNDQSGLKEFNLEGEKVNQFLKQLVELHAVRIVSLTGAQAEHKLTPKDAPLRLEWTLEGGETVSLTVGAAFEMMGHYAQSSAQPNVVFLVGPAPVESWFRGLSLFARDRLAAAPD